MRRTRELSIGHYVAFTVPVLGAVFGINYYIRHHHSASPSLGSASASSKPAETKGADGKSARKIASQNGDKSIDREERGSRERRGDSDEETDVAAEEAQGWRAVAQERPSSKLAGSANDAASAGKDCAQIEYRGEGPELTKVTKAQWEVVMDQFHGAKSELLGWLKTHRHEFSEGTAEAMERQVKDLKIQRPPAADEPDLAWRGVGVYSQPAEGEAMVKIGGGFVNLAMQHPARAKFELARLVAQSWAPCELSRAHAPDAWSPLLKCLNITENQACAQGSYSESGWAVSTTVAAAVAAPGCQIPVFHHPEFAKCLDRTAGRTVASVAAPAASVTSSKEHP